jgi:hypothetical protein
VQELQEAITPGGAIKQGSNLMFENGDINRLMGDIDRAVMHLQRLDQKSIGCILAFHRELLDGIRIRQQEIQA